jgi:hypothetical protein
MLDEALCVTVKFCVGGVNIVAPEVTPAYGADVAP